MKVLKFGGTSVGTVGALGNVKGIVENIDAPVIVVVSALGGLTDNLIATAKMAASGDCGYLENMDKIASRHYDIARNVVPEERQAALMENLSILLRELKRNYDGVFLLRSLPERTLDVIVSFGERMSSLIVAEMIEDAEAYDSLSFVKTEKWFAKNIADQNLTSRLIKERFANLKSRVIVPGFISTDRDTGEITNLGRGGSDFTAALIAAALDAETLEIWTDVDGFMTADPRIITEACVIPEMSFVESMELCSFGAKVIYPPTIYPVFHKNIEIKILNTFNPKAPGTRISEINNSGEFRPMGISAMRGTTLFTIYGNDMSGQTDFNSRVFNVLSKRGQTILPMSLASAAGSAMFAVSGNEADSTREILESEFAPELSNKEELVIIRKDNLATLAVVARNIKHDSGLYGTLMKVFEESGIEIHSHSDGSSETTFTFVVNSEDVNNALQTVHTFLF